VDDAVFIEIEVSNGIITTIMQFCGRPSVRRPIFFRMNLVPEIADRVTLSRAWNRASLHGHYKAINHINRAKEAGPEGGTRCSSEDGQDE